MPAIIANTIGFGERISPFLVLRRERSDHLEGRRHASHASRRSLRSLLSIPEGGSSAPQIHLLQALVLLLLLLDVLAYYLCVPSYCGYEVCPRPEVLAYKISLLLSVYASQ